MNRLAVSLELTVVQSNEEDPLDHVIDVELLTYFLLWAEWAANLCHGVIKFIQALWHTIIRVIRASWEFICQKKQAIEFTFVSLKDNQVHYQKW